jgi:hypothetical protein
MFRMCCQIIRLFQQKTAERLCLRREMNKTGAEYPHLLRGMIRTGAIRLYLRHEAIITEGPILTPQIGTFRLLIRQRMLNICQALKKMLFWK